jgi:hypothetical protein
MKMISASVLVPLAGVLAFKRAETPAQPAGWFQGSWFEHNWFGRQLSRLDPRSWRADFEKRFDRGRRP